MGMVLFSKAMIDFASSLLETSKSSNYSESVKDQAKELSIKAYDLAESMLKEEKEKASK